MTIESFRDYGIDLPDGFRGNRMTTCPRCSQDRKKARNKCLSVNGDKGAWHCFHCGWKGFLKTDAAPTWRERRKLRPVGAPSTSASAVYHVPAVSDPGDIIDDRIVSYFAGRGISAETLKNCGVYSTYHYLGGTGEETLCIAFPYRRAGRLVNVKYRDAAKNMAQEKDPEPCLWNIDSVTQETRTVYITEGEIDALTLAECGFDCALSVDKGAPNPNDSNADGKLECVVRCLDALANVKAVCLVTDKDAPGLRLEKELIARLGVERCLMVTYPPDCKDVNDVLVKHGREAVCAAVAAAAPEPVEGLYSVDHYGEVLNEFWRKGVARGLSTGWRELDEIFTVQPGSVNVVTGIPTSGKSEFLNMLMVNMMRLHRWNVAVFSPEMMPPQNLLSNFAEKVVGKPFFGAPDVRMSECEKNSAAIFLGQYLHLMVPEGGEMPDVDWILKLARVCIKRYDCRAFVIDPFNELDQRRDEWMNENEYIGKFMSKLRNFVRTTGTTIWLVAHPTKLKKDPRTGLYPVATLYDVCGSSNFYNKADNGLSLWRNMKDGSNVVKICTVKVKNKHIGYNGRSVEFTWNRGNGRFAPYYEARYGRGDEAEEQ